MSYSNFNDSQFMTALSNRHDLDVFNENKVSMFALELFFGLEDVLNTLSSAITGGADDAKTDILFVNRDHGSIVLIQAYEAQSFKVSAKGNKGADLSYALGVLLTAPENDIPAGIRPHVLDARAAMKAGDISMLHVWYLHNLPESQQIKQQMQPIIEPAKTQLIPYQTHEFSIELSIREIGLETLDLFYKSSKQAIIIDKILTFDPPRPGFKISKSDWHSFITTIPGSWLANLYRSHNNTELFSANVRGFMGANKKDNDKVINAGIQESANDAPLDFFVFNNGITALVHDFETDNTDQQNLISIKGISIVNGAQTTGSLGSLPTDIDLSKIQIGVRFIKCENKSKIESITRYNNSQNRVIQSDFRANDFIQKRLREEFKDLNSAEYDGGLRGYITQDRKLKIDAHSAAQALMAWHGNPSDSYHKKMMIWDDNDLYSIAFDASISAQHILFTYTLLEASNLLKDILRVKEKSGEIQQHEKELLLFLNERGSSFLIIHAMSKIIETLLETNIKAPYGIGFKKHLSRDACINLWKDLLIQLSYNIKTLNAGLKNRLSNKGEIAKVTSEFTTAIGSTFMSFKTQFKVNPYNDFMVKIENKI